MVQIRQKRGPGVEHPPPRSFWRGLVRVRDIKMSRFGDVIILSSHTAVRLTFDNLMTCHQIIEKNYRIIKLSNYHTSSHLVRVRDIKMSRFGEVTI